MCRAARRNFTGPRSTRFLPTPLRVKVVLVTDQATLPQDHGLRL